MTSPNTSIRKSPYYSVRTGKNPHAVRIDLPRLLMLFQPLFEYFEVEGYFQESLGYECVDAGFVPGYFGQNLEGALLLELHKTDLTPIRQRIHGYSEDDLFDIIEFLYDHCALPTQRTYHDWCDCGWHCKKFDRAKGQLEFLEKVNKILSIYSTGFALSLDGEILHTPETGLEGLFEQPLAQYDPENVDQRIDFARRKFLRRQASDDDRRDAVRELADVLEFLRPELKQVLTRSDESDLFNIANSFGVRHHNSSQKTAYDKAIWYEWMFYHYMATINAALRLIQKKNEHGIPNT
jgi:hypothetical protein